MEIYLSSDEDKLLKIISKLDVSEKDQLRLFNNNLNFNQTELEWGLGDSLLFEIIRQTDLTQERIDVMRYDSDLLILALFNASYEVFPIEDMYCFPLPNMVVTEDTFGRKNTLYISKIPGKNSYTVLAQSAQYQQLFRKNDTEDDSLKPYLQFRKPLSEFEYFTKIIPQKYEANDNGGL